MPKPEKTGEKTVEEEINEFLSDEPVDNSLGDDEESNNQDDETSEVDESSYKNDDVESEEDIEGEDKSDGEDKDSDDAGDDKEKDKEKVEEEVTDDDDSGDDEDDDSVDLAEQNARLLKLIEQLSGGQVPTVKATEDAGEVKPEATQDPQTPKVDVSQPVADVQKIMADFLGDRDVDDVIENRDSFNAFLQDYGTKLNEVLVTNILRALPQVVSAQVRNIQTMTEARDKFYTENPDLQSVKQYVGRTINEVAAEHADWALGDILNEAAKRARTNLGIIRKAKEVDTKVSRTKPALPRKASGSRGRDKAPSLSKLQKQVDSILD